MAETARILSNETNFVVVQTPGRRFPGIVIQGDNLRSMQRLAREVVDNLPAGKSGIARDAAVLLVEMLDERIEHYERVLAAIGQSLPY